MTPHCRYCKKELSKERGEVDHGCLDCAGYIYRIYLDGKDRDVCVHCLWNNVNRLESALKVTEKVCDDFAEANKILMQKCERLEAMLKVAEDGLACEDFHLHHCDRCIAMKQLTEMRKGKK